MPENPTDRPEIRKKSKKLLLKKALTPICVSFFVKNMLTRVYKFAKTY